MINAAIACAPVLGLTFAAAVLAPMSLSGWNLSTEALGFKFERLDPLAGLQRMVSVRGFVELGKSFAKFGLVSVVAWLVLRNQQGELMHLGREPISVAVGHAAALCGAALLSLGGAMALIAAIDVPWQLWQYHRELRMSREEIREENKESEGSPEVRGRIRAVQQAMARRRMMAEVPRATVVVTNPTHYAVALRYDEKRNRAPIVVAKGAEAIAARIREIAAEHGVPLVEAPPLARVLYRNVEIGVEIPAGLYVSVAQILTYVFQLRTARSSGAPLPDAPQIDPGVENMTRYQRGDA
jgi:flagellar biosynthetic protein FlhB